MVSRIGPRLHAPRTTNCCFTFVHERVPCVTSGNLKAKNTATYVELNHRNPAPKHADGQASAATQSTLTVITSNHSTTLGSHLAGHCHSQAIAVAFVDWHRCLHDALRIQGPEVVLAAQNPSKQLEVQEGQTPTDARVRLMAAEGQPTVALDHIGGPTTGVKPISHGSKLRREEYLEMASRRDLSMLAELDRTLLVHAAVGA
mmetsp:Transcript_88177/g.284789  ORF Transcript_88177/g.284789 Transcript_88177/m.284789 type:complete len:202 (-) Transcript_88177:1321-1926(-)